MCLLVFVGVELDAIRRLAVGVATDTLAGLGVPVLDPSIVAGAQERATVIRVANVTHSLGVAREGA